MSGVKGKSGGKRAGAGRPRQIKTVSEKVKTKIIGAANLLKRKYGVGVEEKMLSLIYDDSTQDTVKASVFKTYMEAMIAKETKVEAKVKMPTGPGIYIPKELPDQAEEEAL